MQVLLFNPLSTPDLDLNDHCLSWSDEGGLRERLDFVTPCVSLSKNSVTAVNVGFARVEGKTYVV